MRFNAWKVTAAELQTTANHPRTPARTRRLGQPYGDHGYLQRSGDLVPESTTLRHVLRKTYSDRWLRVHGLAGAKRLPSGLDEERELLHRHGSVIDRLLPNDQECAIIVAFANGYRGGNEPTSLTSFDLTVLDGWADVWASESSFADDMDDVVFAASRFRNSPGLLAPLVLDVAYGRSAPVLIFGIDAGCVYSSYDGGADLFFESTSARNTARQDFIGWISQRPDGL